MAAIGFRDKAYATGATATTNITIPATVVAGDYLMLFAANGYTPVTPVGWTTVTSWSANSFVTALLCTKVAGPSDAGTTVAVNTGGAYSNVVGLLAFTGAVGLKMSTVNSASNLVTTLTTGALNLTTGEAAAYFGAFRGSTSLSLSRGTTDSSGGTNMVGVLGHELAASLTQATQTFTATGTGYALAAAVEVFGSDPFTGALIPHQPVAGTSSSTGWLYKGRSTKTADTGSVP